MPRAPCCAVECWGARMLGVDEQCQNASPFGTRRLAQSSGEELRPLGRGRASNGWIRPRGAPQAGLTAHPVRGTPGCFPLRFLWYRGVPGPAAKAHGRRGLLLGRSPPSGAAPKPGGCFFAEVSCQGPGSPQVPPGDQALQFPPPHISRVWKALSWRQTEAWPTELRAGRKARSVCPNAGVGEGADGL